MKLQYSVSTLSKKLNGHPKMGSDFYTGKKNFVTFAGYKDSCKSRPEAFFWVFLRLFKLLGLNNLSDQNFDCFLSFRANLVCLTKTDT